MAKIPVKYKFELALQRKRVDSIYIYLAGQKIADRGAKLAARSNARRLMDFSSASEILRPRRVRWLIAGTALIISAMIAANVLALAAGAWCLERCADELVASEFATIGIG